jgi:hypothetical protein
LCTFGKTSRSITHPEIAPGQARLTLEFFAGGLPEKKVYLNGMSILSILLTLEPGCHTRCCNVLVDIGLSKPSFSALDIKNPRTSIAKINSIGESGSP